MSENQSGRDINEVLKELETVKADLAQAQARMMDSARMVALGDMTGGISHEINNPLAIILAKAGQMKSRLLKGPVETEKLVVELDKISLNVERVAKIIKGLRTFSRPADKDSFQLTSFFQVIQDCMELCKERMRSHGVDIRINCAEGIMVQARGARLAQVIMNLIGNGHDAVQSVEEKWIQLDVEETEDWMKLRVTDSGPRISADLEQKMMQPFFTTKDGSKSLGVGLNIVQAIAEEHHGRFYYDPSAPQTCFVFEIPKRQPVEKPDSVVA